MSKVYKVNKLVSISSPFYINNETVTQWPLMSWSTEWFIHIGSDTLLFSLVLSRSDCQASKREFWLCNLLICAAQAVNCFRRFTPIWSTGSSSSQKRTDSKEWFIREPDITRSLNRLPEVWITGNNVINNVQFLAQSNHLLRKTSVYSQEPFCVLWYVFFILKNVQPLN